MSGNDKLFRIDLDTLEQTQLTFGTHDDAGAQFIDDETVVFSSTATDPAQPIDPDVARNGNIFNIWTLDLRTGQLEQYTDTLTGNVSPIVLQDADGTRIAFVTYFRGEYGLHTITREEPLYTAVTSDFGAPGPIIDFQAPLTHNLIAANSRKKGKFEKLFLEGRPPINIGVTNNGDILGGTQITFSDVLGDQQFSMFASSAAQYRTLAFSYLNLSRRFQYALQAFSQEQFLYGFAPGSLYSSQLAFLSRDQALAVQTVRGGSAFGIYPLSRYRRFELSAGAFHYNERFANPGLEQVSRDFQQQQFGTQIFRRGMFVPFGVNFHPGNDHFPGIRAARRQYRPGRLRSRTPDRNTLDRQTLDVDARYYLRLGETGLLALRGRGLKSWGGFPDFLYFGGNSELRGYDYLEFIGHRAFFANAELRFPLIEAMLTPIGVLGGIRGTFFFNLGAGGFNDQPFKVMSNSSELFTPTVFNPVAGVFEPGRPVPVSGFRLVDGRASYGFGLTTLAIGFPIHFDWSWRTLFNKDWEDALFSLPCGGVLGLSDNCGGSDAFRKGRFDIWIGYDF